MVISHLDNLLMLSLSQLPMVLEAKRAQQLRKLGIRRAATCLKARMVHPPEKFTVKAAGKILQGNDQCPPDPTNQRLFE